MACVMLEYLEPSDEINDWMNWAKTVNPCWFHVVGNARRRAQLKTFLTTLLEQNKSNQTIIMECGCLLDEIDESSDEEDTK